jgi:hypothetical protein
VQDGGTVAQLVVTETNSTSPSFPGGTLPLCVLVLDSVGRVYSLVDYRPSSLVSIPPYAAGAFEVVSAPTLRAALATSFSVPRTADMSPRYSTADLASIAFPSPGFTLGGGQVSISGINHTIPPTYISCKTTPVQLTPGQVTQIFVSATGALTSQVTTTSGTFPANVLAICEATTDSVGLIRNLVDWRSSYI